MITINEHLHVKKVLGYIIGGLLFLGMLEGTSRFLWQFGVVRSNLIFKNTYSKKVMWADANTHGDIHPTAFSYDSALGWTTLKNIQFAPFAEGTVTHNEFGVRINPYSKVIPETSAMRIVTLGDSFTYGDEVDDSSTYPAQLEKRLPGAKVYNLGATGYGVDQMLWRLEKYIQLIKPNVVILSPIAEDIGRANGNYLCFFKPFYLYQNGRWDLITQHMQSPEEVEKKYYFRSKFLMLLSLTVNKITPIEKYTEPDKRQEKEMYEMLLQRIHNTIKDSGAKPVYCLIPYPQMFWNEAEKQKHLHWQKITRQFCEKNGVNFFALDSCFASQVATSELKRDGHWQYQENRTIAKCLSTYLKQPFFLY